MRCAVLFRNTRLGPVLLSPSSSESLPTSCHWRCWISLRRHPVRSRRRMISACIRRDGRSATHLPSSEWSRRISSCERKRVRRGRGLRLIPLGGIGRDVTVDDGPVHDLVEHLQGSVRATRSGGAVSVEPPGDVKPCDPAERHGAEFRQELGSEDRDGTLAGRWLEPVQAGCLPLAFDKLAEPWNRGRVGV